MAINSTKFFYPPTPGSGLGAFDNIVGFQVVEGGGLTNAVFDFTTSVTEKVNRTFSIGSFSEPLSLEDLDVDSLTQSRRIQQSQFRVYPNYDVSQVLNFSLYGSLAFSSPPNLSFDLPSVVNHSSSSRMPTTLLMPLAFSRFTLSSMNSSSWVFFQPTLLLQPTFHSLN